ncbi:MAG: MATE family efflux transporter [Ruminococcaceae bacterium]|nr:MATE family efflux transporter [Oscillospiraceae bacterium]
MSKHHINYKKIDTGHLAVTLTIFLPVFIETALSSFYGVIDMMMVGKYDADGLAAIGLTSNPLSIFLSLFQAINVGTTTLVAWNVGAKKMKEAQDIMKISLILNLVSGIVMTVFGMLMSRPIVAFMGGRGKVAQLAIDYYDILVVGTTFQALTFSVTAAMRGAGLSKVPMMYNTFSNLLNVVGNWILIDGKFGIPPLGVLGAGYSTLISRIICCLWALWYAFYSKGNGISFRNKYGKFVFQWKKVVQMLRIGIPSAVENLIMNCGSMFYVKIVNSLGNAAFSAHQICNNVNSLTSAPSIALGVTANTVIGQYLGAGEFDNAKKYKSYLCRASLAISVLMGTIEVLFARQIAGLYVKPGETEILALALPIFYIVAVQYITGHLNGVVMGALRAAGDTQFALYLNSLSFFFWRIPLAYLFGVVFGWGLTGVWLSLLAHSWLNFVVIGIRYRSGKWLGIYKKANE